MKRLSLIAIVAFFLFAVSTISGCVELFTGDSSEEETLRLLTPDDIESIFAAITVEVTDKYVAETDAQGNNVVYWLKGGEVWHASKNCGTIAKADESSVSHGTIEEAIACGKKRSCKICSDGAEAADFATDIAVTSAAELHESVGETKITVDKNTVVYWLRNGTVWHLDYSCRSLSGSEADAINIGTISDAYTGGKKRGCKNCASDVELDYSILDLEVPEKTETAAVETDSPEKYVKEYAEDGGLIVFWLDGSKIWHESRYCSSLSRTDPSKLCSGCIEEAIDEGKERACKNCS